MVFKYEANTEFGREIEKETKRERERDLVSYGLVMMKVKESVGLGVLTTALPWLLWLTTGDRMCRVYKGWWW